MEPQDDKIMKSKSAGIIIGISGALKHSRNNIIAITVKMRQLSYRPMYNQVQLHLHAA